MSGLGILATGLAGGASAMGTQLTKDIANQEEMRMFAERKAIEELAQIRLLDYQDKQQRGRFLFERDTNPGGGGAAELGMIKKKGEQITDEEVRKAGLLEAQRVEQTKKEAADPAYMAAARAIRSNDPLVAAQIAQAMAAAGSSSAHTALLNENLTATKKLNAVADKVRGLQNDLSKAKNDATRNDIQQQITDLGFTGKDVTKFLEAANRMQDNATNALKLASDPGTSEPQRQKLLDEWSQANNAARQLLVSGGVKIKEPEKPTQHQAEADALDAIKTKGWTRDKANALLVSKGYKPLPEKAKASGGGGVLEADTGSTSAYSKDMEGISFAGDGYSWNGRTYGSINEAKAAREKAKLESNPMSQSLLRHGD